MRKYIEGQVYTEDYESCTANITYKYDTLEDEDIGLKVQTIFNECKEIQHKEAV